MPLLVSGARAALSSTRLCFSSTRFAFTTLSLAFMHGPHQPMSEKGSHSHRPIAGQSPHCEPIRDDNKRRLEMSAGINGDAGGARQRGGVTYARVRARALVRIFCVVCERVAGISARERGGILQERALPPNRFRPGVGRFGLV